MFESILTTWKLQVEGNFDRSDVSQRFDVLLILIHALNNNILTKDIDDLKIYDFLNVDYENEELNSLFQESLRLDWSYIRDNFFIEAQTIEEKTITIEQKAIEITKPKALEVGVTYFQVPKDDGDEDVLSQEGFMDTPEIGETNLDLEFLKTLGYSEYEC